MLVLNPGEPPFVNAQMKLCSKPCRFTDFATYYRANAWLTDADNPICNLVGVVFKHVLLLLIGLPYPGTSDHQAHCPSTHASGRPGRSWSTLTVAHPSVDQQLPVSVRSLAVPVRSVNSSTHLAERRRHERRHRDGRAGTPARSFLRASRLSSPAAGTGL